MYNKSVNYQGIDYLKLIFALIVVAIHTNMASYFQDDAILAIIVKWIFDISVPVFFIASGFFAGEKMKKEKNSSGILRNIKSLFRLYLIWGIWYTLLGGLRAVIQGNDFSTTMKSHLYRSLIGSPGGGLWYVFSLLCSFIIIYILFKRRITTRRLYVILFAAWMLFCVSHLVFGKEVEMGGVGNALSDLYTRIFLDTKIFTFWLLYVVIGIFASYLNGRSNCFLFILMISSALIFNFVNKEVAYQFFVVWTSFSIFEFALTVGKQFPINSKAEKGRKLSTIVYFTHYTVILVIKFVFELFSFSEIDVIIYLGTVIVLFCYGMLLMSTSPKVFNWLY